MSSPARVEIRVGLLDDHPVLRETVALGLRAEGFDVVCSTGDTRVFLEEMRRQSGAVAIVDLRIDGRDPSNDPEDGVEVLLSLRGSSPRVLPMVFSADTRPETIARCRSAGGLGFLSKVTAELPEIASVVRRVAAGERDVGLDPRELARRKRSHRGPLGRLTPRELEVLSFLTVGADNLKIAVVLGITERTVRAHMHSLYAKLAAENRTALAILGQRLGVQPPAGY